MKSRITCVCVVVVQISNKFANERLFDKQSFIFSQCALQELFSFVKLLPMAADSDFIRLLHPLHTHIPSIAFRLDQPAEESKKTGRKKHDILQFRFPNDVRQMKCLLGSGALGICDMLRNLQVLPCTCLQLDRLCVWIVGRQDSARPRQTRTETIR